MGRRSDADKAGHHERITDRLIRGRMRFKPEATADVLTWLLVLAERFHAAAQTTRERHRKDELPGIKQLADEYASLARHCEYLATLVTDPWSKYDWLTVMAKINLAVAPAETDEPESVA
jgi:hypothetical protein